MSLWSGFQEIAQTSQAGMEILKTFTIQKQILFRLKKYKLSMKHLNEVKNLAVFIFHGVMLDESLFDTKRHRASSSIFP